MDFHTFPDPHAHRYLNPHSIADTDRNSDSDCYSNAQPNAYRVPNTH